MTIYRHRDQELSKLPESVKGHQIPPESLLYTGGYAEVTMCNKCKSTGFQYDQHFIQCCKFCGGNVSRISTPHIWRPPVYEKVNKTLWFITYEVKTDNVLREGFWEAAVF